MTLDAYDAYDDAAWAWITSNRLVSVIPCRSLAGLLRGIGESKAVRVVFGELREAEERLTEAKAEIVRLRQRFADLAVANFEAGRRVRTVLAILDQWLKGE